MPRVVRCSIIQASNAIPATEPLPAQKQAMIEKHLVLIRQAAQAGAQIVCLRQSFNGPSFCAATQAMRVNYSIFEGFNVRGNTRDVYSRGELIVSKGALIGKPGDGHDQPREARGGASKEVFHTSTDPTIHLPEAY